MGNFLKQLWSLPLLLGVLGFGYWRWIRPRASEANRQSRLLLALLTLTFAGGFVGAFFWWFDQPLAFSWDLPPLASRMLAAAGWSFALVTALTLERPTRMRLRLVLWMLVVYLAPLVLPILLFHLDRFDFSAPITYAFLLIAGGMSVASVWALIRLPSLNWPRPTTESPTPRFVAGWLWLVAAITGLWGVLLFVTDRGSLPFVWVWPGDLLTSRLIAVMLLTLAVAAIIGLRGFHTARTVLATDLIYGLGVAVAGLWNLLAGKPLPVAYVGWFGVVFLISSALLIFYRSGSGTP